jgi:hypothetical protein
LGWIEKNPFFVSERLPSRTESRAFDERRARIGDEDNPTKITGSKRPEREQKILDCGLFIGAIL